MATKGEITRTKILDEAAQVFQRKGFLTTTINDLLDATGMTKGNLYFHFASKEEVGLAVLRRERDAFGQFLDDTLHGDTPGARLDSFFCHVMERNCSKGFVGGCLFGNTALETCDNAPSFAELVSEVFVEWIDKLEETIRAAQANGQLRQDLPADQLAELVVGTIEGGIMQSRLKKEGGPLKRALDALRVLLELKP
ncbi:MAG: TetR/AcrR family transcriptional regulator [Desulfuromonadales bacterium]|nr:TetR/AcrR family transcriptional regulator [Desulfuromonadales bacterium]MDT8422756.1 TetR/AcrR family transcriptional regulator [Desulfuromonadales bacterium]